MDDGKYWIAINGSTVAHSGSVPLKKPTVIPKPQGLIGFPTFEESVRMQQFMLTAPIRQCEKELKRLRKRSDVVFIEFDRPDRPTFGVTVWQQEPTEEPNPSAN